LETGAAGTSNALDVAASCGLPSDVLTASRGFLEERGALAIALKQLELEREELHKTKTEVEELKGKLQSQTRHLQRESEELGRRRRAVESEVRSEFAERIAEREKEIAELVREVQSERSMGKAVELQKKLKADASTESREAAKLKASSESASIAPLKDKPKVGQRVFVLTVKQMGEVLEVGVSEATVQVGMLKMRLKFSELALNQKKAPKSTEKLPSFVKPSKDEQAAVLAGKVVSTSVPSRCDLRGQRVLEAREALLQFLDAAFLAPQPRLTIVHGHGSGALKTMVRDLLVSSTIVKDFRSGENNEGGEGVTVVTLDC
jgi:DNA mismatch repair protein MutS2